jgi:hypothetical protein
MLCTVAILLTIKLLVLRLNINATYMEILTLGFVSIKLKKTKRNLKIIDFRTQSRNQQLRI